MNNETTTALLERLCEMLEAQLHIQNAIYAESGIDFCCPPVRIHIYNGIDKAAELLGEPTNDEERADDFAPLRRSFRHNGIEFFQLSNKDGSFEKEKRDDWL